MGLPREGIRKIVHAVIKRIKPFNHENTSPREYEVRKDITRNFTTQSWNEATLFIDGTHIAINANKFMKEPQWINVSFFSYKLRTTAVVLIVK